MDFNPTSKTIRSQDEVEAYLTKYGVRLPSNVKTEWCPPDIEYTKAPKIGGVYLHPQVLPLELTFHMTSFINKHPTSLLRAPSQLVAGGWHVVLSF